MVFLVHHLLERSAERTPAKTCLVQGELELDYAEVDARVGALAGALVDLGVARGDRVAVHLDKSAEEAMSLLAVSRAGGIFVDANSLLKPPQVRHILADSGARVLVVHRNRLKALAPILRDLHELRALVVVGEQSKSAASIAAEGIAAVEFGEAVLDRSSRPVHVPRIDADPAAIIYTSGSTGLPKGVVVSHRNVVAGAESVTAYLRNTPDDVILSILPFSFDYGMNQLMSSLLAGATLVLQRYLGPADILRAAQRHPISGLAAIPPIWAGLLELEWTAASFPHLRYMTNSGGTFPEAQVRAYRERLPRTEIYLMYGLTEAFRSTYLEPDQVDARPASMGKAIPNAEILVIDDEGRPCRPGEVGQLVHRGVHVALGYWNDPERTAERYGRHPIGNFALPFEERVVYSGDYVTFDEEGFLYFVGRRDQMIKTAGFRVSPTEVEEHFHQTGLVRDVVAFGVPDPQLGQAIVLVAVLAKGAVADAESLRAAVEKKIPSYMMPRFLELREDLPRNANGKVDRARIIAEHGGAASEPETP